MHMQDQHQQASGIKTHMEERIVAGRPDKTITIEEQMLLDDPNTPEGI